MSPLPLLRHRDHGNRVGADAPGTGIARSGRGRAEGRVGGGLLAAAGWLVVLLWWVQAGAPTIWPLLLDILADPAAAYSAFVLAGAGWITVTAWRRVSRRFGVSRYPAVGLGASAARRTAPLGEHPRSGAVGFGDARRARHEAGHVVTTLALGGSVRQVDIRFRPPDSGGRTESRFPPGNPGVAEWHLLVMSMGGAAVDLADGHRDAACSSDVRAAQETAVLLSVWGFRSSAAPEATDPWALTAAALREARRLVGVHADAVDRIGAALVTAHRAGRTLRDPDVRALLDVPTGEK